MVGNAGGYIFVGCLTHNIERLLSKVRDHRAVVFARDEVRNLPVEKRNVLRENVVYAACDEACGSALYDVKIGDDQNGSAHRGRFFLAVQDGRADVRCKAVGGGERRNGDKGDAELVRRVAAEVHDSACAVGDDDLGLIELFHHFLDNGILGAKAVCLKHYLLVGGDVLALGELIDDRVVYNGALFARKTDIGHVPLEIVYRAVFDDDLFRLKLMVSAADAFADVFFAIHDHDKTPQLKNLS